MSVLERFQPSPGPAATVVGDARGSARPPAKQLTVEVTIQVVIMFAIGAAASFTDVHEVAATHGQPGWLAWADAVVLELMSMASGQERLRHDFHGAGLESGFPAQSPCLTSVTRR